MTITIEMRGRLEPLVINGGISEALHAFSLASAQGTPFVLLQKPDGKAIGIQTLNILTLEELEDEGLVY